MDISAYMQELSTLPTHKYTDFRRNSVVTFQDLCNAYNVENVLDVYIRFDEYLQYISTKPLSTQQCYFNHLSCALISLPSIKVKLNNTDLYDSLLIQLFNLKRNTNDLINGRNGESVSSQVIQPDNDGLVQINIGIVDVIAENEDLLKENESLKTKIAKLHRLIPLMTNDYISSEVLRTTLD